MIRKPGRHALCPMVLAGALMLSGTARGGEAPSDTLAPFEQLSRDLRGHPLDQEERRELTNAVGVWAGDRELFVWYVERWLVQTRYRNTLGWLLPSPARASALFLGRLARATDHATGRPVYFLGHDGDASEPPCGPDARASVRPWWGKDPIEVCSSSYRPERVFAEACGARLLGCLPPTSSSTIEATLEAAMRAEIEETTLTTTTFSEPIDALLTGSRTWQSGAVEFLYLRHDLMAAARTRPWSPEVERDIDLRLGRVDLATPGRWLERSGGDAGTGLFMRTPAARSYLPDARAVTARLLHDFLCSEDRQELDALVAIHAAHGDGAVARAVVGKPQLGRCMARRAFQVLMHRDPKPSEHDTIATLERVFQASGHRWFVLVRAILLSDMYLDSARGR